MLLIADLVRELKLSLVCTLVYSSDDIGFYNDIKERITTCGDYLYFVLNEVCFSAPFVTCACQEISK
jgi:hypothetical protein